jgi:ectoine hydroxylase-related dioxygenase (phytanoyl-CoA dioxygenase family)
MENAADAARRAVDFATQGYTLTRGFFSKEEAARLLADVNDCIAKDERPAALSSSGIVYTGGIFNRCAFTRELLSSQRVIDFIASIAGGDLWVCMDQAVTKHPGAGIFRWHQDNGYNRIKVPHFQLWIALTETRLANGALMLAPGSHKRGLLPHKFAGEGQMEVDAPIGENVVIDATAGDAILFSSLALHCTGPNRADSARVAYVAEYMALADYAYQAKPPYFVVSKGGKSCPQFVQHQVGAYSLKNQMRYFMPRVERAARTALRPLREALRKAGPS